MYVFCMLSMVTYHFDISLNNVIDLCLLTILFTVYIIYICLQNKYTNILFTLLVRTLNLFYTMISKHLV